MGCSSCRFATAYHYIDIEKGGYDYLVALAGNPNTGKSTVFNALTGLHQHVGNWPGKTVVRTEGLFKRDGKRFKLVDLPGTYSLLPSSVDEQIASDFLLFGQPHVTIIVVNAASLERNLNLVLQILGITDRVVVCLNLVDEAARKGLKVDAEQLSSDLGVPVISTIASSGKGLDQLAKAVSTLAKGEIRTSPRRVPLNESTAAAIDAVVEGLNGAVGNHPARKWIAIRILEGDPAILDALTSLGVDAPLHALSSRNPLSPVM